MENKHILFSNGGTKNVKQNNKKKKITTKQQMAKFPKE